MINWPNVDGIKPAREFLERDNSCNCDKLPSCGGIEPIIGSEEERDSLHSLVDKKEMIKLGEKCEKYSCMLPSSLYWKYFNII